MRNAKLYCWFIIASLIVTWGCTKSNDVTPKDMPQLFVPTAFTPNGDGVNDIFKVVASAPLTYYNITIYDENNIIVYHGTDINKGWNGTYKEDPEPVGSYLWVINYQAEGTPVAKLNGALELIR